MKYIQPIRGQKFEVGDILILDDGIQLVGDAVSVKICYHSNKFSFSGYFIGSGDDTYVGYRKFAFRKASK